MDRLRPQIRPVYICTMAKIRYTTRNRPRPNPRIASPYTSLCSQLHLCIIYLRPPGSGAALGKRWRRLWSSFSSAHSGTVKKSALMTTEAARVTTPPIWIRVSVFNFDAGTGTVPEIGREYSNQKYLRSISSFIVR